MRAGKSWTIGKSESHKYYFLRLYFSKGMWISFESKALNESDNKISDNSDFFEFCQYFIMRTIH